MSESYLERLALAYMEKAGIPMPTREYRFCPDRRWRADFVWLHPHHTHGCAERYQTIGVLLEVDGGTWMKKGGHTTGQGFQNNCDKLNEAALMGFTVLRVTKAHIISGQMVIWLRRALGYAQET